MFFGGECFDNARGQIVAKVLGYLVDGYDDARECNLDDPSAPQLYEALAGFGSYRHEHHDPVIYLQLSERAQE